MKKNRDKKTHLWTLVLALFAGQLTGETEPDDSGVGVPVDGAGKASALVVVACDVRLTEMGRRASFAGSAIYESVADGSGALGDLDEARVPPVFESMLHLDDLEACLADWQLMPEQRYTIVFTAGTTGDLLREWSISACPRDGGRCLVAKLRGCTDR